MTLTVILIGLSESETVQIESWIHAIDPEIGFHHADRCSHLEPLSEGKEVCLGVLKIQKHDPKPWRDVSRFKRFLPRSAPLLVLIPTGQSSLIRHCVKSGADDYWILPFNEEAFLPRLQVLLEWAAAAETAREAQGVHGPEPESQTQRSRLMSLLGGLFQLKTADTGIPAGDTRLIGNKWKIVRNLGGGSYGEVWEVENVETGERAVAKIPHSVKMNRRFMQEAGILKRFRNHPHAVHMREIAQEGGKVVLIQEFVEGKTLQQLLEEGMEGKEKEKGYRQLVEVVAYAHDQNIMHRDIKPENIIIQSSGDLKLLDFGTGKHLIGESVSSTIIGSRPYMSPEQIKGQSCLASDVWALGVILYALATGLIPFYYDNDKALMDAILECEPEKPTSLEPGLSPELERIILRCLEKEPENRYPSARELLEDLLKTFPSFGDGQILNS